MQRLDDAPVQSQIEIVAVDETSTAASKAELEYEARLKAEHERIRRRTAFFPGMTLEQVQSGKTREMLEQREYGTSQLVDFTPIANGILIEFTREDVANNAIKRLNLPDNISNMVISPEHTVAEAREAERKRKEDEMRAEIERLRQQREKEAEEHAAATAALKAQADGQLETLKSDLQYEKKIAEEQLEALRTEKDMAIQRLKDELAHEGTLRLASQSDAVALRARIQELENNLSTLQAEVNALHSREIPPSDPWAIWASSLAAFISWNRKSAPGSLTVDGLKVSSNTDNGPLVVQADRPLAQIPGCKHAVGYFEITVHNPGKSNIVTVGLASHGYSAHCHQPGWSHNSFGYHGDDGFAWGNVYNNMERAASVKGFPTWKAGDVIGVGYIMDQRNIFITVNGKVVGTPFTNVVGLFYPTVGIQSLGASVTANFGAQPFKFDIQTYSRELK